MVAILKYFKEQFDLILQLTKTSFKLRNEGSYLGIAWYLLNPLLIFLVLYLVFAKRMGADIEHYGLYLLLGLIVWNFLSLTTTTAMNNLLSNSMLIKSLNFKRESLIISSIMMGLVSHFFEIFVFLFFLFFFGIKPFLIILYPLILILLSLFALGLSFILSSLVVYFRDLNNIWVFVSRVWWFATPIFYSINQDSGLIYRINLFNPMYYFLDASRDLLIYSKLPQLNSLIILLSFSIGSFILGHLIFKKLKNKFAELT